MSGVGAGGGRVMGNGKRNRTGGGRSEEEVGVGEEAGHMKMD